MYDFIQIIFCIVRINSNCIFWEVFVEIPIYLWYKNNSISCFLYNNIYDRRSILKSQIFRISSGTNKLKSLNNLTFIILTIKYYHIDLLFRLRTRLKTGKKYRVYGQTFGNNLWMSIKIISNEHSWMTMALGRINNGIS